MPAQRRRRKQPIQSPNVSFKKRWVIVAFVFIGLISLVRFFLSSGIEVRSFSIVYPEENGDAVVSVYDFNRDTITHIRIPGDTSVTTGFGLGEWRVKSLRELGEQEQLGGELLRMSMTKAFHFPVDAWSDGAIPSANPSSASSFLSAQSSLTLKEKLQVLLFAIQTPKINIDTINLAETSYLHETKLSDGEMGYQITRTLPPRVATAFSMMNGEVLLKIGVYDMTGGSQQTLADTTEVLHVLGGDWAIVEQPAESFDCYIRGEGEMAMRISRILLCDTKPEPVQGNFTVEVAVGEMFAKRF